MKKRKRISEPAHQKSKECVFCSIKPPTGPKKLRTPSMNSSPACGRVGRLCDVAGPDAVGESATDLGVVRGGEDLGVAGLALV